MDLQDRLRTAVIEAYQAAGLTLAERHVESLAQVYSDWAAGADEGVVQRIQNALAQSLGVPQRG